MHSPAIIRIVSTFRTCIWIAASVLTVMGCKAPEGIAQSEPAAVTIEYDFDHRPLPEIPLPNDIAMRPDRDSATGYRINASMIAPTAMEQRVRTLIDSLDGWGVYQPISIPFTGPIDVQSVLDGHRDVDYDLSDDVVYLVNIDLDSEEYGRIHHLDVGNGNYPVVLEDLDNYGNNDPRGWSLSLLYEEADEDRNGNGELDPGERDENGNGALDPGEDENGNGYLDPPEDDDADGVLDVPNYLPGHNPGREDLTGRADALMTFYERETDTLIVSPMEPLRGRTTYAAVVTKRITDLQGNPVGSPFPYANHAAQTEKLQPLLDVLPEGLDQDDIAFTWPFTTQSIEQPWIAVREGLYGHGPQAHLAEDFPGTLDEIFELKNAESSRFTGRNLHLMHHEDWAAQLETVVQEFFGADLDSQQGQALVDSHGYIDYHVIGSFTSPQLWDRFQRDENGQIVTDENGEPVRIPLDLQSWPQDLDRVPAEARGEKVYFWLVVPRKDVSRRGQGEPAPVVLLGHGYGGNRVGETMGFAGFLAQFGIATLAIDNVSHGLDIGDDELDQLETLLGLAGLGPVADTTRLHRADDLDRDGRPDSGVDFWTSYLFHTRDMMRQSALDYMQLIRILRRFDGDRRWQFDLDEDGKSELAGDFDGDGQVDIGGDAPIHAMGGSLGGIMSTILGGVEPEMSGIVPIAGGGRLTDVGFRSLQGGVPQAVMMRIMGPVYNTTLRSDGTAEIVTQVTELNKLAKHVYPDGREEDHLPIDELQNVLLPGDTMVVENLENGERGCSYLLPEDTDEGVDARARVNLASDAGDRLEIRFYRGPALVLGSDECAVEPEHEHEPIAIVDRREHTVEYLGKSLPPGELRAITEGLGLRRANPELRRFVSIGQMVIDPADPGVHARNMARDPLQYPRTGDETKTHAMIVTTVGDMNVPASTGVTVGRSAGFIDYLRPDARYEGTPYEGLPSNQILIDTYTAEAVNTLKRFIHPDTGEGIHMDVENFSGGTDLWGDAVPRLEPPLRLMSQQDVDGNPLGGYSGAIFTYAVPEGQHGFAVPGEQTDKAIARCEERGEADCEQLVGEVFDVGWYMFHAIGRFFQHQAQQGPLQDDCNTKQACNDIPPTPEPRDPSELP